MDPARSGRSRASPRRRALGRRRPHFSLPAAVLVARASCSLRRVPLQRPSPREGALQRIGTRRGESPSGAATRRSCAQGVTGGLVPPGAACAQRRRAPRPGQLASPLGAITDRVSTRRCRPLVPAPGSGYPATSAMNSAMRRHRVMAERRDATRRDATHARAAPGTPCSARPILAASTARSAGLARS